MLRTTQLLILLTFIAACTSTAPEPERGAADGIETTRYRVAGLSAPASIRVDRWGVPHIDAATHYDAFFVQGFNAARDRLWQIDTWRRRGLGRLSEVLGADYVEQDRAARLFLYRGSMFREWLAYGSDAKAITESFTAGVNAWIRLTQSNPELLAPEFGLLGYAPEPWAPEDIVRIRGHGLWRNIENEVRRAQLLCRLPARQLELFMPLEPDWTLKRPTGLDPCDIPPPATVLRDYRLAKRGVDFAPAMRRLRPDLTIATTTLPPELTEDRLIGVGSNNWAVAPQRTSTGRPILADDPHRAHGLPSLRYVTHLRAPGLDVIGAGEPALPGISIGHNQQIGFGLTIFSIDQEDLVVYDTDPDRPGEYLDAGNWARIVRIDEEIPVLGEPAQAVTLAFTRHGPVLHHDPETGRLFAARVAWLEPGMAPYFGSVEYMRAGNWREFVAALNRWGAPAENQVYADVEGNIGYKPAGLAPRRVGFDGLLPVPADGRHEWQDYHDMDALPELFNPPVGWVATANQMSLPAGFDFDATLLGLEWTAPWRYRRIASVLAQAEPMTPAASVALQRDYGAPWATELTTAALARVSPGDPGDDRPRDRAVALLQDWLTRAGSAAGGVVRLEPDDEPAAALWGVWTYHQLMPALTRLLVPDDLAYLGNLDTRGVVRLLREPRRYDVDPDQLRTLLDATLAAAWQEVSQRLGRDPANWRWGDLHLARFEHPLLPIADGELAERMRLPPVRRGGDGYTPNNTVMDPMSFEVRGGASFRMVLDVGNWDAARMTNAPSQSGVPGSPHYGDLLPVWAEDGSVPLIYSEQAIRRHVRQRIDLEPEPVDGTP